MAKVEYLTLADAFNNDKDAVYELHKAISVAFMTVVEEVGVSVFLQGLYNTSYVNEPRDFEQKTA